MKGKKIDLLSNRVLITIMVIGFLILAYPSVSDWWNSFHQSRAIASYVETVANLDQSEFDKMIADAEYYNASLIDKKNRFKMSEEETRAYNSILDVTGTGIMGYVQIPKIHISYPIYHGTEDTVLQIAIGHIAGSSLPVGGAGTHCLISGHRGLPSARLFTDIDKLTEGDTFVLQVLDRTYTYEVDQIRIVLPEELDSLTIDPEKDYCTLITCTPYGINTHRLLVRGHRVDNELDGSKVVAEAIVLRPEIVAPVIAVPMLVILLVWVFLSGRKKQNRHADDELI